MKLTPHPPQHLHDLPMWRLLVALADAERAFGPADPTTRTIARAVQKRLQQPVTNEARGEAIDEQ